MIYTNSSIHLSNVNGFMTGIVSPLCKGTQLLYHNRFTSFVAGREGQGGRGREGVSIWQRTSNHIMCHVAVLPDTNSVIIEYFKILV